MASPETPRISIGIPVHNGADVISRCIDGVLSQDFRDIEIIVSDDASTDGTGEIVKAYAARDARVKYYRQDKNLGMVGNFKFVFDKAQAPYFIWVHDDDYFDQKDYLTRLFQGITRGPGYDLAYPAVKKFWDLNGERKWLPQKTLRLDGTESRYEIHRKLLSGYYLGYQVLFGLAKRDSMAAGVGILFNSFFWGNIADEEAYLHFVFSRHDTTFVPEATYIKDMTHSAYYKLTAIQQLFPVLFHMLAAWGVLAQSKYTHGQKLTLMALKAARCAYIVFDMFKKDVIKGVFGKKGP